MISIRAWCALVIGGCAGVFASAQGLAQAPSPVPGTRAAAASSQMSPRDGTAPTTTIRAGSVVRPDTVTVGDPFFFEVSLEVPMGASVQWPVIADSTAPVAMRAATRVASVVTGALRRETATYALSAWDVGTLSLGLADASVRLPEGVRTVSLRDARIVVRPVLPADTSLHVPKAARGLFPRVIPWYERWWPAAVAVAALALLWWAWRHKTRRVNRPAAQVVDPFARAMHDFDRLKRLALADLGERGRAVALAVEVVRNYLSARVPNASLSRTSDELLAMVADDARVPAARLARLLSQVDGIKFARGTVSSADAEALHAEAREVVESVEGAEQARRKREEAQREVRAQFEEKARRAADDAARRRPRKPKAGVR